MPMLIKPTVGRIVLYYPSKYEGIQTDGTNPVPAIISGVVSDKMVNLAIFDFNGNHQRRSNVYLIDEGEDVPHDTSYCGWMPYQVKMARQDAS